MKFYKIRHFYISLSSEKQLGIVMSFGMKETSVYGEKYFRKSKYFRTYGIV